MAGFGFTFFNALFYTAAQYTTAINLGIIQCTMPAYIILGAAIIFRNRQPACSWLAQPRP